MRSDGSVEMGRNHLVIEIK